MWQQSSKEKLLVWNQTASHGSKQMKEDSYIPKYAFCFCMQKSQGFIILLVYYPKQLEEPNGKVVNILIIHIHLLCKNLGCWLYHPLPYC